MFEQYMLVLGEFSANFETLGVYPDLGRWLMWFYFFGASSKDHIIDMLESFDDPMRIFQFVTNFAVVFYQMNTFAKTPYTLKAK